MAGGGGGGGGGGTQQSFLRRGSAPTSSPIPSAFMYHFFDKTGTPFVYLLLTNGTNFTHLVKNFTSR